MECVMSGHFLLSLTQFSPPESDNNEMEAIPHVPLCSFDEDPTPEICLILDRVVVKGMDGHGVRGCGGRFLSKKKLIQPPDPTFNPRSRSISDASCLDRINSGSGFESYSRVADCSGSSTSCLDNSSISNNNGSFQRSKQGFTDISPGASSVPNGIRHYASVVL
ncbi:Nuclear transcription factor Y subunit A-3, putative isoform 4 [Hibiscus syriacus]|uniref:Nuclear transcription factor Y subunit A-3, putative isoform 4 n=1 Tax=Hibiscus syriacus TaxID=106335 RepID=A0A6A3D7X4_HIBSY|nr:Nuclear transcription factor Y subunit A-3, putative isoform 4 [Hibiscus syriacus]